MPFQTQKPLDVSLSMTTDLCTGRQRPRPKPHGVGPVHEMVSWRHRSVVDSLKSITESAHWFERTSYKIRWTYFEIPWCTSPISHIAPFVFFSNKNIHTSVMQWNIMKYCTNALFYSKKRDKSLQWRHNEFHGVSNHQPLLNRRFRHRSKKTPKLRVTGLCAGNSLITGEFPAQKTSNAENVSIWWCHHGFNIVSSAAVGLEVVNATAGSHRVW